MSQISIKVTYNGVKRRFSLPTTTNYEGLENTLCDMFPVSRPFSISYIDNDNDVVALSSDSELTELFNLISKNILTVVSMTLHDGETPPSNPEPQPREQAREHPRGHHRGPRHGHPGGRRGGPWGRGYGGPGYGGPGFGYGGQDFAQFFPQLMQMFSGMGGGMGGFGGMPGFMGMFGPFMASMPEFSENVRSAFSAVKDAAMSSNVDHHTAFKTIKQIFPALFKSLRNAIEADSSNEGALPSAAIDTIVNELQTKLQESTFPEGLTSALVGLVRAALGDAVVMKFIRSLPLSEMESKIVDIDMYMEGEELSEEQWAEECKGDKVPKAPLQTGDSGPRVRFLQKLLTDLGYMNKSMYAKRAGVFANRTKQAVEKFQKEFGLESSVITGVYDATTAATLESVMDGQTEASKAGPSSTAATSEVKVADSN